MDPNRLHAHAVSSLTGKKTPCADRPLTDEEGRALAQALEQELLAEVGCGGGRLEIGRIRERSAGEPSLPLRARIIHALSDRRDD